MDRDGAAGLGFQMDPPKVIATGVHLPIALPEEVQSLDTQAKAAIEDALEASERVLKRVMGGRRCISPTLFWLKIASDLSRSLSRMPLLSSPATSNRTGRPGYDPADLLKLYLYG